MVCCVLFAVCVLCVRWLKLRVVCWSSRAVRFVVGVASVCCLLCGVCCLLFVVCSWLLDVCGLWFVVVCWLLVVGCWSVFVVC